MPEHRLTMPSYEPGACHIIVNGHRVGFALGRYADWQAYLSPVADQRVSSTKAQTITRRTLRDLRAALRGRLAEHGPWWTEEDTNR